MISSLSICFNIIFVFGAQKNRIVETVLLSIHNICFGRDLNICLGDHKNRLIQTVLEYTEHTFWLRNRKIIFNYAVLLADDGPDVHIANFIWTQIRRFP